MHNNFYFLNWLVKKLQTQLVGSTIIEIYSQDKDVLIIGLQGESMTWIKAHLRGDFACLTFPEDQSRARRNSVNLFTPALQAIVSEVVMIQNDRSFYLVLDNGSILLFKMHGNRSNVIFFENNIVVEVFKNSLGQDLKIEIAELAKPALTLDKLKLQEGDIQSSFPVLGKENISNLMDEGWLTRSMEDKWATVSSLIKHLNDLDSVFIKRDDRGYRISFISSRDSNEYDDPREALNKFFVLFLKDKNFKLKKQKHNSALDQQIRKTHTYLQKTRKQLDKISQTVSNADKADLIMANLHQFEANQLEKTLLSFDGSQEVVIKLKIGQSPIQHAQNLYRKSKNKKIEIESAERNIEAKEKELAKLLLNKKRVEESTEINELDIVFDDKKKEQRTAATDYLEYEHDGFTIRVGRNAKNNDKLTFQHGYKEDMWLHVKDARGSHVLIKYRSDREFPAFTIEKAAQLAAWFSKRKTEGLVPVIYTPRKFVRKRKGDPAGAVVVEKEKVMLINPENW